MSGLDATLGRVTIDSGPGAPGGGAKRVLVVFESGPRGAAALREAAELAEAGRELSVVTLAPQARPQRCCGGSCALPYNRAVRDEAELELRKARDMLGATGARATFTVLAGCPDPPLAAWVVEHEFELILLPHHRLTRGGGRLARGLRQATDAEVRLVK